MASLLKFVNMKFTSKIWLNRLTDGQLKAGDRKSSLKQLFQVSQKLSKR